MHTEGSPSHLQGAVKQAGRKQAVRGGAGREGHREGGLRGGLGLGLPYTMRRM